jgi:hypothetical protein
MAGIVPAVVPDAGSGDIAPYGITLQRPDPPEGADMPKSVPPIAHGPKPVGPYSVATEANGFVFVSGPVAFDPAPHTRVEDAATEGGG